MCDAVQEETYQVDGIAGLELPSSRSTHRVGRARRAERLPRHGERRHDAAVVRHQSGRLASASSTPPRTTTRSVALAGDAEGRHAASRSRASIGRAAARSAISIRAPEPTPRRTVRRALQRREIASTSAGRRSAGKIDVLRRTPIDKQRPDTDRPRHGYRGRRSISSPSVSDAASVLEQGHGARVGCLRVDARAACSC